MDKQTLLNKYISNLGNSPYRNQPIAYAKDFLQSADAFDKESIDRYLDTLRREGKAAGTVHYAFGVIRRLYLVNQVELRKEGFEEWPYRRGEAPQVRQREVYKPRLDIEVIRRMVEAAKDGNIPAAPACFLAISTTYGPRREEMCDLGPADVDLAQGTIFISTVKFGRERYHLIPQEIKPYLERHDFSQRYSPQQMSRMFWVVVNGAGLDMLKSKKLGWHAIRRSVDRLLHDTGKLSPLAIHNFLRWKSSSQGLAMDTRYYETTVVGLEETRPEAAEAESDRIIFKHHPLLRLWR